MPSHTRGGSVSIKQKKKRSRARSEVRSPSVGFRVLPVENVAIWRHSPTAGFPNAVPPSSFEADDAVWAGFDIEQ